jgi:multimeric flavodoxin WrbA
MQFKILGLSGSLRNARRGGGNARLVQDLVELPGKPELMTYLKGQAAMHLANFKDAGRTAQLPFDELYKNLKKLKGDRGMSNSEIALAAALWAAHKLGAEIEHLSLAEYFDENGQRGDVAALRAQLLAADGLIISGPVYFGDRGSLAQSLIDWIREDPALVKALEGKVYCGIAVGAKRNGGQETTLIYQLQDMIHLGLLGVGNDSETTSQYGGTGHAGDVGTMPDDMYGIDTSMGAGRRIARVCALLQITRGHALAGKPRVAFWILQDRDGEAARYVRRLLERAGQGIEADVVELADQHVVPCLACDVCPTHIDNDDVYRCIIKSKRDAMPTLHERLIAADAVIPVAFSPRDRKGVVSNYQTFMERTRYLRRGDYIFSDVVCAPLVLEELGCGENLSIRMMTSMIRHHTIVTRPLMAYRHEGKDLNEVEVAGQLVEMTRVMERATLGRLLAYAANVEHLRYNPVGYVLAAMKDVEDQKLQRRRKMIEHRIARAKDDPRLRVLPVAPAAPARQPAPLLPVK